MSKSFTSGFGFCECPKATGVAGAPSLNVDVLTA